MATPQLSPGVLVREIDLTVGRSDNVLDNIGAIAGPFKLGPIDEPTTITTQQELIDVFGTPQNNDRQYEYWMTASEYLTYGGILSVVRSDGSSLVNANAGVGIGSSASLKIKSYDDYQENYTTSADYYYAARNPGEWGNQLKVCTIDNQADQILGITTTNLAGLGITVGYGVTTALSSVPIPGAGTTTTFTGVLKGIITGVSTDTTNSNSTIDVKVLSRVNAAGTEFPIDYQENNPAQSFEGSDTITIRNNAGGSEGTATAVSAVDWYDQQTLQINNSTIFWKTIAPKPVDTNFATSRGGGGDAIHVAVVDDTGAVTGIAGNLLESWSFLSKAIDSEADGDAPVKNYYKNYLAINSDWIFPGLSPAAAADTFHGTTPVATAFTTDFSPVSRGDGLWGLEARDTQFNAIGNVGYNLLGGADYSANSGQDASLGDLSISYNLFSNRDDIEVDYLLMGPGCSSELQSQAKANLLISIAEQRKDCMAVISPHRENVIGESNSTTQTNNLIKYYAPITSSSFAVFDSGYKYTYDRFNNEFRYVPLNGDIAGLMVRTSIEAFPWFSPAGQQRGNINNAVKLAYNPNKAQRDVLYGARINPVINQNGQGVILFGDKTGLSYSSAFDRINVRRLFLTVEQALEEAANDQLFELNDEETRENFVNIVIPYLRDIQAQRGIDEFTVVCDETNNTPDIIDNNEFRADIFIAPARSINYITLTFIATRSGISFDEVVGTTA